MRLSQNPSSTRKLKRPGERNRAVTRSREGPRELVQEKKKSLPVRVRLSVSEGPICLDSHLKVGGAVVGLANSVLVFDSAPQEELAVSLWDLT